MALNDEDRRKLLGCVTDATHEMRRVAMASRADNDGVMTKAVFDAASAVDAALRDFRHAVDGSFEWEQERQVHRVAS